MRWQLASTFAATAMSAGCYEETRKPCGQGVLCPRDQTCTGNPPNDAGKPLCGNEADVEACVSAPNPEVSPRQSCVTNNMDGLCISRICSPCSPELYECRYSDWTPVPSPTTSDLKGIHVTEKNRAYAVGAFGTLLTYDGVEWKVGIDKVTVPMDADIEGVWAAEGRVMVVGGVTSATNVAFSITPSLAEDVWGDRPDNFYGAAGEDRVGRFDGAWTWTNLMNAPLPVAYHGVWGWPAAGTTTAIAVGKGSIAIHKGATWTTTVPALPSDVLNAVWGISESDYFVVGEDEVFPVSHGVIYRFQNNAWTANLAPPGTAPLNGIWGSGPNDIFAVGDGGTILHFDGNAWSKSEHSNGSLTLNDVSGVDSDVYIVGDGGAIWRLGR